MGFEESIVEEAELESLFELLLDEGLDGVELEELREGFPEPFVIFRPPPSLAAHCLFECSLHRCLRAAGLSSLRAFGGLLLTLVGLGSGFGVGFLLSSLILHR